jgi:hypothetical protein
MVYKEAVPKKEDRVNRKESTRQEGGAKVANRWSVLGGRSDRVNRKERPCQ